MTTTKSSQSKIFTLRDVLQEQARDLYDAQCELISALKEMDEGIETSDLHEFVKEILMGTMKNIADLEAVCTDLEIPPTGVKCEAMAGLLREAKGPSQEYDTGATRDAAIIAIAQRIAHYEIAGFGTARAFARKLRLDKVEELFSEMLERSCDNDTSLTKIATGSWFSGGINDKAARGE